MKENVNPENDPKILKDVRQFLKELNANSDKPMEQMEPNEARKVLEDAQNSKDVKLTGISEIHKTINCAGKSLDIVVVKPEHAKNIILPAFIFIHGGGWILGDYPTHKRLIRDLVVYSGAAAVYVDYSRSPEEQFPVAINELYEATLWIAENGKEIGVDGNNLAVAGNSVGGNMATVLCIIAKEKKLPLIKFQLLLWPVTDADFNRESWIKYGAGRFLTSGMMKWMWDNYLPDKTQRKHYHATPLNATLEQLSDLPPAVVQLAENDILFDEGLEYARKLDDAGVETTIETYNGLIHDYGLLNPLNDVKAIRNACKNAALSLKNALFK